VTDKPPYYSSLFAAIPSDSIQNSTKQISVQTFPSCSKSDVLYQRICLLREYQVIITFYWNILFNGIYSFSTWYQQTTCQLKFN